MSVMSSVVSVVDTAHDLGVTIDSRLTMTDQVAAICRSAYYQLRQLRTITRSLSTESSGTSVHRVPSGILQLAPVYDVTDDSFQRLHSVQNTAACLVSASRRDHITPVLQWLHWLPVRQRVEFKLTLLAYKAITLCYHRTSLATACQLVTAAGRRHLRSSDVPTLTTTPTSTRFGDCCFQSAAARLWNRLLHFDSWT